MAQYNLASNGLNTPPPFRAAGTAHVVGSSPTAVTQWVGHAGELAIENGEGGYGYTGKAAMKDHTFMYGGTLYTHSGSALVAAPTVDAEVTALGGLTSAADKVPYFTGAGTAAVADFTAFGRSLAACANAGAAHTILDTLSSENIGNAISGAIQGTIEDGTDHWQIVYWDEGAEAYVPLALPGGGDGNYKLQLVKAGGVVTGISWVADA